MVSEALIIHMLSTWSGYGVFGTSLLLLQKVVGAMVSMVSDGLDLGGRGSGSMGPARLDLGGRGYGVYGVWVSVVGLWCLWCLMVWT